MFGSRDQDVTCIACGDDLPQSEAREYDKEGDRWARTDKEFEYLCKSCDRQRSRQPRDGLEATLVECDAGEVDRDTFLAQFIERAEEGPVGDR